MSYIIKYNYNTGDSENNYPNNIETLELTFNSLELAKDALRRIKEHYTLYRELHSYQVRYDKSPRNRKAVLKDMASRDWAVLKKNGEIEYEFALKLLAETGKHFQLCAPWCGYFESLNEAWIEMGVKEDDDMRISFN